MRTYPSFQSKDNSKKQAEAKIKKVSRKVAIAFILLVQIAIIFKMLI